MFERKTPFINYQAPLDYILNPRIASMLKGQKWFANPDRVKFFAYEGGSLIDLADSVNPILSNGDVIWFSFTLQYVVNHTWGPDVQIMDVVRVGRIDDELGNGARRRRALRVGDTVRVDGMLRMLSSNDPLRLPLRLARSHFIFLYLDDRERSDHSQLVGSGSSSGVKPQSDYEMVDDFGDRNAPVCAKRKRCDDEDEFIEENLVDYDAGSYLVLNDGSI